MAFHDRTSGPAATAAPSSPQADPRLAALCARRNADLPADESDEDLMLRIAAGDQAAFRRFARRHVSRSLAVAQRISGNWCDAEEIVQDALLRVWQHAAEWTCGEAKVTTWLYRVVLNLAIDHLRKNRQRFVAMDEAGDPVDPAPSAQLLAEGRQLETMMNAAIAALPTRQRVALTLCYFEAMDCAEAAQIMQISVSAMESLLVRGRRTLRARLARFGAGDADESRAAKPQDAVALRRRISAPLDLSAARLAGPFGWVFAA
jgi:RNA polymerase sigma-70 factor (ECF subfamily)